MSGTTTQVYDAIQPALVGTAFGGYYSQPPHDDGRVGGGVVWCAATTEFVRRHPDATAPVDQDHPHGCTDLWVCVGDDGCLDSATMEFLDLDDGLVGRPIEQALPVIVERIRAVLA